MSHDLRTPLAAITGSVTALLDGAERIDEPTRFDLLQSIREDAEFLERQVRNMLDLTRLESGTLQIHRELHPLDEVVGGAMTRVEKLFEGRRVDADVPADLPLVSVDALLLEQLLVNLLENAARYAPAGSPVEVCARRTGPAIRIDVADRGPGIPSGQHERIFEKFHRGGADHRSGGAGLGLAIGKAIVQLHGGRIWAEDREGGGARFCVELPLPSEAGS
jgi:two-component system sensor histidine kinase KdpD